jgi:hypothetical protein
MTMGKPTPLAFAFMILWVIVNSPKTIQAQGVSPVCNASVTANEIVASGKARFVAGQKAQPPLTDHQNGFAWPDTPLGVLQTDTGYAFFGSDGGFHARQVWNGSVYGNNKYGSATRTNGTLDNPLASGPPIDVTIGRNPDPTVNPNYSNYDYMGGGPVYQVPTGMVGAGNLLMVYHGEIPTTGTRSFYSVLALAASSDEGAHWTDLGEIIRVNQSFAEDLDGFDIGDAPLVVSPDGNYFYIYFRDWQANGTTHWENTITLVSVARASIDSVLQDAFGGGRAYAAAFEKYYAGNWDTQPGIGGLSTDLDPNAEYSGELQVAYNAAIQRYSMVVGEGVVVAYSESADGMQWTLPTLIFDFRNEPDMPTTYESAPVFDPDNPGSAFYVFYTRYPTTGAGWTGATVNRFTVSCQ